MSWFAIIFIGIVLLLILGNKKKRSPTFKKIDNQYKNFDELTAGLRKAGLESSNLIIGIDFTKSNEWSGAKTFGPMSMHSLLPNKLNPYQSVIQVISKSLEPFDEDKQIPVYGFGDVTTTDKRVFPFYPNRPCNGLNEILQRYGEIVPHIQLSGPTSFAPIIYEAINIVRESRSYHILVIIADGQVTDEEATRRAIVEASEYPLSIITIGVGDGPWDRMEEFDDELPQRKFDNFQFVNYHQILTRYDNDPLAFATAALMEIPEQYQAIQKLGLMNRTKHHTSTETSIFKVMWNYVVTANKPTAVSHSLVGNFTSPTDLNLIISKCTRIEIHMMTPEGLQPMLDVGIYGRIANMELFRPKGEKQDLLFILTERYKFCILAYDAEKGEIITRANGDVQDRIGRPSDSGPISIIDPECRLIGLHMYDGLFKVIPIDEKGQLHEAYNMRLEELTVIDMKFLHGCARPTIALLYQDTKETRHVKTYEVNLKDKEFVDGPWSLSNVEGGSSMLIAVPKPLGGAIIVGEQTITYHSGTHFKSTAIKTTIMKAAGRIDPNGSRYLLGDHLGRVYVLVLTNDGQRVSDLKLEVIGECSYPSTLNYLDNGFAFVGSTFGDSQVIKLRSDKDKETGQYIDLVDTFANLGPIVDFTVVDLERQGQGQVVTCSGAYKDGSLRVVRNGIGINEHAAIELDGIKGIWSVNPAPGAQYEKYLIVAFVGESRVLGMAGEELDETEIGGFEHSQQTIYAGNVVNNQFIQVTGKSIFLVDATQQKLVDKWTPPGDQTINVCACNSKQILLAVGGKKLHYLEVDGNKIKAVSQTEMPHEISCVNIDPAGEGNETATLCAVGLWTDISVRVLRVPNLQEVSKELLGGEIIPRSVLFASFEGINYLLVALGDGHLFNFTLDLNSGALSNRKKVSLGTQPVILRTFVSKGQSNVFACSDRPTVIYSHNKKLLYSNVNLKEVNYMAEFNCDSFPDSLALATENSLTIGTIDEIQKLHIRTVPLGEMPRRIAHQESTRTFGLVTIKYAVDENGEEVETNYVKILDDQTYEVLDRYKLDTYENACSLISMQFSNDTEHYFVVGTAFAYPNETEPSKGRFLVFRVSEQKLVLVTEAEAKGAIYSLSAFNGKLLAGVNSKVQLHKWNTTEDGVKELASECDHPGHILALYLASRGDFIIVGDLMKSISLLVYKPVDGVIEELARDYNPNWMTAVEMIDDDTYIGGENSFNLFTVRKNSDATTEEDRGRLEVVGEFHLGEFVNRFRHDASMTTTRLLESISPESFTFGLSICYFVLSVVIGVQILRLICFRHRIFSFQFGFMFMCLLECLLRTVYFFFYQFWNMELQLGIALYWFPINIQFATFLFLVLFFVAVIHKKTWEESWKKKATILFIFVNITLLALFLVSLFFGVRTMALQPINGPRLPPWINKARELFSAGVFFILMAVVAGYGSRVRKLMLNAKNQIPQLQSISVTKLTTVLILLVFIFTSRSIIDFVCVLSNDCSFYLGSYKIHMPTFGNTMDNWVEDLLTCFLYFVWEIAPAIIVLLLFYKIPSPSPRPVIKANNSTPLNYPHLFKGPLPFVNNPEVDLGQSAQVFRNPLRYDSDDETGSLIGSVASSGMNYGSFTYIPYSTSSSLNSD